MPEVPRHVGLILDGNRRWAKSHGLPALEGHRRGKDTLHTITVHARDRGVKYLTVYAFSTENWKRSGDEVGYLMDMIVYVATIEIQKYVDDGIKLIFVGSRAKLSKRVLAALEHGEQVTAHNDQMTLAVCINYGGHMEIAEAMQEIIDGGAKAVSPELIAQHLYHPEVPDIDLVIRTSGEKRLSNFMLWRAAYAELMFTDILWPDYSTRDFDQALEEYATRARRYGK